MSSVYGRNASRLPAAKERDRYALDRNEWLHSPYRHDAPTDDHGRTPEQHVADVARRNARNKAASQRASRLKKAGF